MNTVNFSISSTGQDIIILFQYKISLRHSNSSTMLSTTCCQFLIIVFSSWYNILEIFLIYKLLLWVLMLMFYKFFVWTNRWNTCIHIMMISTNQLSTFLRTFFRFHDWFSNWFKWLFIKRLHLILVCL